MMAGSVLQAMRTITFTLIWQFDYNTVYHLFLLASLFFFYTGYKKGCACGVIPTKSKKGQDPGAAQKSRIVGWSVAGGIIIVLAAVYVVMFVPLKKYDFHALRLTALSADGTFSYNMPLDSKAPWAKFRANELNNGRSPVKPVQNDKNPGATAPARAYSPRPWWTRTACATWAPPTTPSTPSTRTAP
jgi:hypothetical protein